MPRRLPGLLLGLLLAAGSLRVQQSAAQSPTQSPAQSSAQSPVGLWQTISDVDGKPKAYIRIREHDGEYTGTIEDIIDPEKRDKNCEKCEGARHGQPVLGMTILTGIHRDGDHFGGGEILDPDNGRIYSCKLTVTDGGRHLDVRGFIGFSLLGRTQTWNRSQ